MSIQEIKNIFNTFFDNVENFSLKLTIKNDKQVLIPEQDVISFDDTSLFYIDNNLKEQEIKYNSISQTNIVFE